MKNCAKETFRFVCESIGGEFHFHCRLVGVSISTPSKAIFANQLKPNLIFSMNSSSAAGFRFYAKLKRVFGWQWQFE
jgi:hypothetical protein